MNSPAPARDWDYRVGIDAWRTPGGRLVYCDRWHWWKQGLIEKPWGTA